jgi:hypothetical protein
MGGFGLSIVAIDSYEHHDDLPSAATAERVERLLGPYGLAAVSRPPRADEAADLVTFLDGWATDADGPGSTLLYWVGHGSREGMHAWLLTGASRSPLTDQRAVNARTLANMLRTRWVERTAGDGSWTVLILDVCRGRDAATTIVNILTEDPSSRPGQVAVVEVGGNSATEVGRFVDALEEALAGFTENDAVIPLRSLLFAATDRLGPHVQPTIWLSRDAVLDNPRATSAVLMATQDLVEEWRAVVADLTPDVRDHFLGKAQGTELGELGWLFSGRADDCASFAGWLRDTASGMLVVTGEPGAGKSALLGRFVALADPMVTSVLDRSGLAADDRAARPEPGAFDGVVHLAGRTLHEARSAIEQAVPGLVIGEAGVSLDRPDRRVTLLVDALDEAQAPVGIAYELLRPLARHPNVRVVVGTRRSLEEGPDQPAAGQTELLDALAVTEADALVLRREPAAMADYARGWLARDAPDLDRDLAARIVERVAGVDQPFLFVRLALPELLARVDGLDHDTIDATLSGGHGDVFARAVERLARVRPATAQLLRALAYAHGRGLPRHDGIWATVAGALFPGRTFGERDIAQTLVDAAPYVVLDGEHGETVHRLAHKTFAERFLSEDPDLAASHAAITDALVAVAADVGWREVNAYLLAHLPRHAASSPSRLDAVSADPGWLAAALDRFGIDTLLSILDATPPAARTPALTQVHGAVRRARVALARDPEQLAAQLYARVRHEDDVAIRALVERLPSIAPQAWLRVTEGGGGWTASAEAAMTFSRKVRALAAGRLRDRSVILVGAGDSVVCWDPPRGTTEPLLDTGGERVTALALWTAEGRDLIAVGAGYDGTVTVYAADGGPPLLRHADLGFHHLTAGVVAGAPVVIVAGYDDVVACTLDGAVTPLSIPDRTLAASVDGDTLLVLVAAPGGLAVRRLPTGPDSADAAPDTLLEGATEGVAHCIVDLGEDPIVVVAHPDALDAWHAGTGRHLGRVETDEGFTVRTATALVVDGGLAFAAGNDTDHEGGYVVIRSPGGTRPPASTHPLLRRAVAVSQAASRALVCEDGEAVLIDPRQPDRPPEVVRPGELAELFGVAAPTAEADTGRLRVGPAGPARRPVRLHIGRPREWPVDARAFGRLDGRPVVATAHIDGVCWLWWADSGKVAAGPFGASSTDVRLPTVRVKGGPQPSEDVAYREGPTGAVIARVHGGTVAAWDVRTGATLPIAESAGSEARSVALGVVDDRLVLARGAGGGAISLWWADDGQRLCGLTLDTGVARLWFDPTAPTLVALTADAALHLAAVEA